MRGENRVRRAAAFRGAALVGLCVLAAAGCSGTPLSHQYAAERDLWKARMIERQIELKPRGAQEDLTPIIAAYERILTRYPITAAGSDTSAQSSIGRVRGTAVQTLSRLYFRQGSRPRSIEVLWRERENLRRSPGALVGIYGDLVQLLARASTPDSLASLYREMAAQLPPGSPAGMPYPLVLESPARLGELYGATGRAAEAQSAYGEAVAYYDRVVAEHPGTPLEVAAHVQKANVLARLNRPQEAEQVLRTAQALPAAEPVAAGILFSQGVLREQMLRQPLTAVPIYREVIARWPEAESAVQAALRVGIAFAAAPQADSALAAFDRAEQLYPRNLALAAQSRYLGAKVLMESNRADAGIRRLRSVTTDFPRTDVGLMAPLEIAGYYERAGDIAAEQATLREAEATYAGHWENLKDDPQQADFVRAALDRLAETRTRLQNWSGAVQALLQRAEAFPGDELSPLALAQAATLADTRLGDRQASARILKALVERYPTHPMAPKAQQRLAELGSSGT